MRTDLRPEDVGDLLDQPLIAVLATRRKDDAVMLSPVWCEWRDGGIDIWVPTPEGGRERRVIADAHGRHVEATGSRYALDVTFDVAAPDRPTPGGS